MNIPNLLTIIRLFMVPVFVFTYLSVDSFLGRCLAAGIFLAAAVTDILDGYIARKYNKITDFGKLADPVADKMMQLSAVFCLAYKNRFSFCAIIVFLLKELVLIIGSLNLLKEKFVVQSKRTGKIATVVLFIALMIIMITDETMINKQVATLIMCVCIIFTVVAFFDYVSIYFKVKESRAKSKKI